MQVFQFKITLNDSHPPIWRRIQILGNATFMDLHNAIRDSMGWGGFHLHEFAFESKKSKKPILIGKPNENRLFAVLPEKRERLCEWFGVKAKQCLYTYDFGDNWDHIVLLEKVLPKEPDADYPCCIGGKRACPPDDSGGIWGYERNIKIMKDSKHPEYAETLEWVGEDFDPEEFVPEEVNFAGNEEFYEDEVSLFDTFSQPYIAPPKVGRNEPCPCGSGKKYKKCHGANL